MNRIATTTALAIALTLGVAGCTERDTAVPQATAATPASFDYDKAIDAVVARYHLPGIAVGVIADGKVVYKGTRGKLQSGQSINADTLFKIASNTKAMTVTALARLAQQGKLKWDAPVTTYLPDFQMHDPWVTKHMRVGDLVAHHSGMRQYAGDLMLWPTPNKFTPADVIHGLRYIKPTYTYSSGYSYDNVLFVVAGQVAAKAGGASYADIMRREIFEPLGMTRCQIGTWNRKQVGNVALPHSRRDGKNVVIDGDGIPGDVIHPLTMDAAGGVRCSLNDMLTWSMNWVAPTAKQLKWLEPEQRRKEWRIYTPMQVSQRQVEWNNRRYYGNAHGWFMGDADGHLVVEHTGVLSGMYSAVTLLPDMQSGFVILINASAGKARTALKQVLLKHFTAPGETRTVASYADELARDDQAEKAQAIDTSSATPASAQALAGKLGVWRDPWFGKVRICPHDDVVRVAAAKSPTLTGQVMRLDDRYMVKWDHSGADAWLEFSSGADGTLHMSRVDPDSWGSHDFKDLAFTRVHDCQ